MDPAHVSKEDSLAQQILLVGPMRAKSVTNFPTHRRFFDEGLKTFFYTFRSLLYFGAYNQNAHFL